MSSSFSWTQPLVTLGLILAVGVGAAGCGDDDDGNSNAGTSDAQVREAEDIARQTLESDGENAEYVFAHVTDNLIETLLFSTREECQVSPIECIGEPATILEISGTTVDGDSARMNALTDFGLFEVRLLREDGDWKVDAVVAASDEVPDGAAVVALKLSEFAFAFNLADIPSNGNFAFRVDNAGAQVHEVVVVAMEEGAGLEETLEAVFAEEVPPLAFKVFIQPGQAVDMAFEVPFAPGEYVLVCFFPDTDDPEFAPHLEKGMVASFRVE